MQIATPYFILLVLPCFLLIYWAVTKKPQSKLVFLLITSILFFGSAGIIFLIIYLTLVFLTYLFADKKWYLAGILINLGVLIYFKYLGFGISQFTSILQNLGFNQAYHFLGQAIPLGLSYFIFKHISFLVDKQRNRISTKISLITFLSYSSFFPQISAGPLSTYNDTGSQLNNLPIIINHGKIHRGIVEISIGLAKKILIADTLASAIFTFDLQTAGFIEAWFFVVFKAMILYFDFSGYSDIAMGMANLFGISIPKNFNNPYLAKNPREFWERWHITLSEWFRIYLFFPLSRLLLNLSNRKGRESIQFFSYLITMGLIGLWHGAGWGLVLWGIYHGTLLGISVLIGWGKRKPKSELLNQLVMNILVFMGWGLFFSSDLASASHLFKSLFGFNGIGDFSIVVGVLGKGGLFALTISLLLVYSGNAEAFQHSHRKNWLFNIAIGILLVLSLMFLSETKEFIYARF